MLHLHFATQLGEIQVSNSIHIRVSNSEKFEFSQSQTCIGLVSMFHFTHSVIQGCL